MTFLGLKMIIFGYFSRFLASFKISFSSLQHPTHNRQHIVTRFFTRQTRSPLTPNPFRQTLLFSATQTTKISKLARLSLVDPVYINTSANSKSATPTNLSQTYCIVNSEDKLNFLYSFMKNVAIKETRKTIVFLATCKQVMHAKERGPYVISMDCYFTD